MKHKLSFLLLYGILVLFGGLGALLLIFGEKDARPSSTENRMLAGFPELSVATVKDGSFMSGLEEYMSDSMFDRDRIVETLSTLMARLSFQQASEEEMNDELYEQVQAFAGGSDHDYVPDTETPAADYPEPEPASAAPSETPEETPAPTPATEDAPVNTGFPEEAEATETVPAGNPEPGTPAPTEEPAANPIPAEKDLSSVHDCVFTCTQKDGTKRTIYVFPKSKVQRMIRLLNAFRAVLPEDGHMFFTQPAFPGVANYLSREGYLGWDSDLEETINTHANDGVFMVSALDVLEQPLLDGENIYFRTDHHWTPRGACYVVNEFLRRLGIDPRPYDEYSFVTYNNFYGSAFANNPGGRSNMRPDTLDVLIPKTPVKGYVMQWDRTTREAALINTGRNSYLAYLGGTQGPWRRFDTGVDCGRSCLVIGDSYDCVFIPFLTPYYETVHATDVRDDYYDMKHIRWSISEYIAENHIDDVYFVLSTASGVNTDYLISYLYKFL